MPRAFDDLSMATSQEAAYDAYWRIDNEAIVQGEALRGHLIHFCTDLEFETLLSGG